MRSYAFAGHCSFETKLFLFVPSEMAKLARLTKKTGICTGECSGKNPNLSSIENIFLYEMSLS